MKNKKGFTLVELLVVIVILGIVTGLSIPLIRNIQNNNQKKEYTTYMDTLKYSAKLYIDSYGEDLFGKRKSGCAIIRYSDLNDKGLLKDIPIDNVSCASDDDTFVKVVKIDGKYGYATSIGCGKADNGGNVTIDTTLSSTNIITTECDIDATTFMDFKAVPKESASIKYRKRNVKLTITSDTGINDNMQIYYGYSYNQDTNVINNSWKKLPVKVLGKNKQKEKILSGETISITTDDLVTPTNVTGELYLVIRIDKLENIATEEWTPEEGKGPFKYFGPYIVDNTKPKFNDSTIVSSETGFNSIKPKLQLKVTDDKYSTTNDLRMCISYDNDTCSTTVKDIKSNKYEKYDANKVLPAIQNSYDSSTHTIYVTVSDAAGNYEKKQFTYRIARRWTLTYDANGGNACNPGSKSYTFNDWEKNLTWGDLCSTTNGNYKFTGWNTNADGSGAAVTKDTAVNSNLKIFAQWVPPATYIGHVYSTINDPCGWPQVAIEDKVTGNYGRHMGSCGMVVSANRVTHPPRDYTGFGILTPYPANWGIYANQPNIYYSLNEPTNDVSQMTPLSVYEWYILNRVNMYIYKIDPVPTPPNYEFVGEVHTITTYINHGNWAQWSSGIKAIDVIANRNDTHWGCYVIREITNGVNYTGFGVRLTGGVLSYDAKCGLGNYQIYSTADNMYYSPVATTEESELTPLTSSGVIWGHKEIGKYYIYRKR